MLKGKHILLGITGSIAAYKAAVLVRHLVKEGAEVKVVMTEMAKQFISPLTMATLSKNPILVEFYNPENGDWNSHISLGMWSDLYIIAPASANTIAKMATGVADNLLLTTYLSARCPVMIAPAMDVDMYLHPATQNNIKIVEERGAVIVEPTSGELASGLDGKGRMEEPEIIVKAIKDFFLTSRLDKDSCGSWAGKKVLITAGPTVEKIDPVRFISNHSTGKMGYAIANEIASRGAYVTLVSGPVSQYINHKNVNVIDVTSAAEMYTNTIDCYNKGCDVVILSAAVADFTPEVSHSEKIKREKSDYTLKLIPTTDIAASLGEIKREGCFHLGFALETDNEESNAIAKITSKKLDAIVLNSLRDKGAGFGTDTNVITIISKKGDRERLPLMLKTEAAKKIAGFIERFFQC